MLDAQVQFYGFWTASTARATAVPVERGVSRINRARGMLRSAPAYPGVTVFTRSLRSTVGARSPGPVLSGNRYSTGGDAR